MTHQPALIEFSDWDPLYRGLWRRNSKPGVTKVGYVTRSGMVVYPRGYGMRRVPLARFRWRHRLIPLPPIALADEIEAFFTLNRDNPELFIHGIQRCSATSSSFASP